MDLSFIARIGRLWPLALTALFLVGSVGWAVAQTQLSPDQTRVLTIQLLKQGNPTAARTVALLLLERDQDDRVAWLALMQAALALGEPGHAALAGRQAYRLTQNPGERFALARQVSQQHVLAGQITRAQWWMRKALNDAPTPQAKQVAGNEFIRIRRSNPLTMRLNFSAAPNNNVNNGSSSDTINIFGLPFVLSPDARALSGIEVSAGVDLKYRLAQGQDRATDIGLKLFGRTFKLSNAAQAAAPDVSGSDYSFALAEAFLMQTRRFPNTSGPTTLVLTVGKNWYATAPYSRYGRLTVAQSYQLADTTGLVVSGGYERQISISGGGTPSDIFTLGTTVNHRLQNRDALGLSLRLQETTSPDVNLENTSVKAGARYGFGKPVLGTKFSLSMSVEKRDYDVSVYDLAGRHDLTLSAGAAMVFPGISYFGFSPSFSVEASRTESNVNIFDRDSVALRMGVQSNF